MNIHDVMVAVEQAKRDLRSADELVEDMLILIVGRLEAAHRGKGYYSKMASNLVKLKKELSRFDSRTRTFKKVDK